MPDAREQVTARVVEHALGELRVPAAVRDTARRVIFDELGAAILGMTLPAGRVTADYARGMGGREQSTLVASGIRVSCAAAALANGTACHADELDGTHPSEGHPGSIIVPATLALAERGEATGGQLVDAVIVGYDIGTRLVDAVGGAVGMRTRFHLHSDLVHAFGAAAGGARLRRLRPEQARHALGLTGGQAAGLSALFAETSHMSKAFASGHNAAAAVTAVSLAERGMQAHEAIFDTEHGVLGAWGLHDAGQRLVAGLGTDFAVARANFKRFSAGYPIHAPVEATLGLLARHGIRPRQIVGIEVRMASAAAEVVDRPRMSSISLRVMLAVALLRGDLRFEEAHDEALLRSEEVRRLSELIAIEPDRELDAAEPLSRGATVTVRTGEAEAVTETVAAPAGHWSRGGLNWDELREKWRPLLDPRIGSGATEQLAQAAQTLDERTTAVMLGDVIRRHPDHRGRSAHLATASAR